MRTKKMMQKKDSFERGCSKFVLRIIGTQNEPFHLKIAASPVALLNPEAKLIVFGIRSDLEAEPVLSVRKFRATCQNQQSLNLSFARSVRDITAVYPLCGQD